MRPIGFRATFLLAAGMLITSAAPAKASLIGVGGFSGSATVITFSELGGVTPPQGPFSIGSVTFSEASTGSGNPGWRLLSNSLGGSTSPFLTDNAGISDIRVDFTTAVNRAGLVVGIGPATYRVSAYDTSLNLLESGTVTAVNTYDGGFIGFQEAVSIGRLRVQEISGENHLVGGIDDVRFEQVGGVAAVPEPSTLVAAVVAIGFLGCKRLRRARLKTKADPA